MFACGRACFVVQAAAAKKAAKEAERSEKAKVEA